jgi:enamine deaminase RidA (YjgF/YER057c/UK114 family)
MSYEEKIKELGLEIPLPPTPVASYVPGVLSDGNIYTSGQLPVVNGELKYKGQVGLNISEEEAYKAAEICALNCLGVIKSIVGSLDKVEKIIKISGFVNCVSNYTQQPKIINGASDLVCKIFGEAGKHARCAVGVSGLPLGAPVEVEMIVKVK